MKAEELTNAFLALDRRNPPINPEGAEFMVAKFLDLAKLRQGRTVTWVDSPQEIEDSIVEGYVLTEVLRRLRNLNANQWFTNESRVLQDTRDRLRLTPKMGDRTMQIMHDRIQTLWGDICLAAIEYGGWYVAVTVSNVYVIRRPAISVEDDGRGGERLHNESGPAVAWPHGPYFWYLNGFAVGEQIVERPRSITVEQVHAERNVEVRRIMQERMGIDRYMIKAGGRKVSDPDPQYGTLWQVNPPEDEPITLLEVINSTAEPDGTHRHYFLRVPNNLRTPKAAAAWTWNLRTDDYKPIKET